MKRKRMMTVTNNIKFHMKTNRVILLLILLFCSEQSISQTYKSAFRADMCDCLETESLKRKLTENAYKSCFRETLPIYAAQIDAQIVEEDINKKYLQGQIARRDLIVTMQSELVYTCKAYFDHLEDEKLSKKLIARDYVKAIDLEKQNQLVAMSPNAYAYFSRAQLHYILGHFKKAEEDVRKSLEVNPNSSNMKSTRNELLLLALIYEEEQQFTKAVALYDQVYFGVYDSPVAILRAIADKNNGGTIANIPKSDDINLLQTKSNARHRRQSARSTNQKQTTKQKTKNEESKAKKKTDTFALKKLFKIDN